MKRWLMCLVLILLAIPFISAQASITPYLYDAHRFNNSVGNEKGLALVTNGDAVFVQGTSDSDFLSYALGKDFTHLWNETSAPLAMTTRDVEVSSNGFLYGIGSRPGENFLLRKYTLSGENASEVPITLGTLEGRNIHLHEEFVYAIGNDSILSQLFKMDENFNPLWNRTFFELADLSGLAVSSDAVYVSGSRDPGVGASVYIIKLSQNGITQWNNSYPTFDLRFSQVVTDSKGDFYVHGHGPLGAGEPNNSTLLKISSNGTLIWNVTFTFSPNEHSSSGMHLTLDRWDRPTIAMAFSNGSNDNDIFVSQFQEDGTQLWNATWDSGPLTIDNWDKAAGVYTDHKAQIYVTGFFNSTTDTNSSFVLKYVRPDVDPSGCTVTNVEVDWTSSAYTSPEYSQSCEMINAYINNSELNSSAVVNSAVRNSSFLNSLVTSSDIEGATLRDSVVSSSNMSCSGMEFISAIVSQNFLTSGRIKYKNYYYSAPFNVNSICLELSPLTYSFTTTPHIVGLNSEVYLDVLTGTTIKEVFVDVTELNASSFSLIEEVVTTVPIILGAENYAELHIAKDYNVYGVFGGGTTLTLAKFDLDGVLEWTHTQLGMSSFTGAVGSYRNDEAIFFGPLQENATNEDVSAQVFRWPENRSVNYTFWQQNPTEPMVQGAVLQSGHMLVASVNNTPGTWQLLVLDKDGNVLDNQTHSNGTGSMIHAIMADPYEDYAYILGAIGAVGSQQPFIMKVDFIGEVIWTDVQGDMAGDPTWFTDGAIDSKGDLILVGQDSTGTDLLIQKRNDAGTLQWNQTASFAYGDGGGKSVAVDSQTDLIYVIPIKLVGDPFLELFLPNGTYLGGASLHESGSYFDTNGAEDVEVSHGGTIFVLGLDTGGNTAQLVQYVLSSLLPISDSGIWPDSISQDGLWRTHTIAQQTNEPIVGIFGKVYDIAGNGIHIYGNISIDTTPPNASVKINNDENFTTSRVVTLQSYYADGAGISGCRFSNINLSSLLFAHHFENTLVAESNLIPGGGIQGFNYTAGISGRAVELPAPSGFALNYSSVPQRLAGSISLWVSPRSWGATGENSLFSSSTGAVEGNTSQGITIYRNDSSIVAVWVNQTRGDETLLTAPVTWGSGNWHHIAVTWNFSTATAEAYLYVDGVQMSSTTTATAFPEFEHTHSFLGHSFADSGITNADATLDEVAIFSSALTYGEVLALYQSPGYLQFVPCTGEHPWQLTNTSENKTVWVQVRDIAGNMALANDSIYLNASVLGDDTPPENVRIYDEGEFTNKNTSLSVSFVGYDDKSEVYYRVRLFNSTSALTGWLVTENQGRNTEYTFTNLYLVENETYYVDVEAANFNNLTTTVRSDGITIDVTPPSVLTLISGTGSQNWSNNISVIFEANGTDNISGVEGISYVLSTDIVLPDDIIDLTDMVYPTPLFTQQWNDTFDGAMGAGMEYVEDIVGDSSALYVIGNNDSGSNTYRRCVVIRYNSTGSVMWNNTYMGTGVQGALCKGADVDSNGNVILVGEIRDSLESFILSLAPDGSVNWQYNYSYGGLESSLEDVAVGEDGNLYAIGQVNESVYNYTGLLVRFQSNGLPNWNVSLYNGTNSTLESVAVDASGNMYVSGAYVHTSSVSDYMVGRYSSLGNRIWEHGIASTGGVSSALAGALSERAERYYTAGHNDSGVGQSSILLTQEKEGSFIWNVTSSGTNEVAYGVDVNDRDLVAVLEGTSQPEFHIHLKNSTRVLTESLYTAGTDSGGHAVFLSRRALAGAFGTDGNQNMSVWYYDLFQSRHVANRTINVSNFADGQFVFTASAIDFAGNKGPYVNHSLWLDSTPGSIPQFLSSDTAQNVSNITLRWTESRDMQSGIVGYYIRVDNNSDFSSPENESLVWNVTLVDVTLPDNGTWYASVRSLNGAGINSSWSNTISKVIDQAAPVVTPTYPQALSTVATLTPSLRITTDEPASCSFVYGARRYAFSVTGSVFHEGYAPPALLPSGAVTVNFECYDEVGNLGTNTLSFTIDTTVVIAGITIQAPVDDAYMRSLANVSALVTDGLNPIVGLSSDSFTVVVQGNDVPDVGIYEESAGIYNFFFLAPDATGVYDVSIAGGTAGDGSTFTVLPVYLYSRFLGASPGSVTSTDHIVMRSSATESLGMASDASDDDIVQDTAAGGLALGSFRDDNLFLFFTDSAAGDLADKKEDLLETQQFLDTSLPSFSLPTDPDYYRLTITIRHPRIRFYEELYRAEGTYEAFVANNGIMDTGPYRDRFNMTLRLE